MENTFQPSVGGSSAGGRGGGVSAAAGLPLVFPLTLYCGHSPTTMLKKYVHLCNKPIPGELGRLFTAVSAEEETATGQLKEFLEREKIQKVKSNNSFQMTKRDRKIKEQTPIRYLSYNQFSGRYPSVVF